MIVLLLFVAISIALVAMLLPGMLNIMVAKISVDENKSRAMVFASGVTATVVLQTLLAMLFAHFINDNPKLNGLLQKIAAVVFFAVSVYFFIQGSKKSEIKIEVALKSKQRLFFSGFFMAMFNMLPVPFQAFMTATIGGYGLLSFTKMEIIVYVLGTAIGTLLMLYWYAVFFEKYKKEKSIERGTMNYIVAVVTGLLAIGTLVRILKG